MDIHERVTTVLDTLKKDFQLGAEDVAFVDAHLHSAYDDGVLAGKTATAKLESIEGQVVHAVELHPFVAVCFGVAAGSLLTVALFLVAHWR